MFGTVHPAHTRIALVALRDGREACVRNELNDLRKKRLAQVHGASPRTSIPGKYTK